MIKQKLKACPLSIYAVNEVNGMSTILRAHHEIVILCVQHKLKEYQASAHLLQQRVFSFISKIVIWGLQYYICTAKVQRVSICQSTLSMMSTECQRFCACVSRPDLNYIMHYFEASHFTQWVKINS